MTQKQRKVIADGITYAILGAGVVMILVPLLWMVSTALKQDISVYKYPPVWVPHPFVWSNFVRSMTQPGLPFGIFLTNSFIVSILSTAGTVLSSSIVAFSFARLRWRGRNVLFVIVVMSMILPAEITMVPQFVLFKSLGWINTFLPLIAPAMFGHAFYIFLLRQYMMGIPREMDEAAQIDGCGSWMVFWKVILPQSKSALLAVTLFSFQANWNDFLRPLIYLSDSNQFTATLGLSMFNGQYSTEWSLLMAAALIVMLPILILFAVFQKYFVQGITVTGLK